MSRITVVVWVVFFTALPAARAADDPPVPAAASAAGAVQGAAGAGSSVAGDFDGDGRADLAIGVVGEDVNGHVDAGAVNVLYGSATGLKSTGNQFWSQDSPGVADASEDSDFFGAALAAGDFNADGFSDLAVGAPSEDLSGFLGGTISDAGAINVLYGTPTGLTANGNQFFTQDTQFVLEGSETGDNFGMVLAAANFGGSSHDDLAIGVPREGLGSEGQSGVVHVLFGSITGLTANGAQLWDEDSSGLLTDGVEGGDNFGDSLAAANLGKSALADLAIGIPLEDVESPSTIDDMGAVLILYGSAKGPAAAGNQVWTQDSAGVEDAAEEGDAFGFSLAGANFGKSSFADLAIGVTAETVGTAQGAGAVNVLYGSTNGLSATGDQFWSQNSPGILDQAEGAADPDDNTDVFSWSLTVGDFGKGLQSDLAIGVQGENVAGKHDVGAVNVLYGSATGLVAKGNQFWNQDSPGVLDVAEAQGAGATGDLLGEAVLAADFGKSGRDDLAIGVPSEDIGTITEAGAVNVLYGSTTGLTATGDQFWHQDSAGIKDVAEEDDVFGFALSGTR
ncbi:MAG: FG-GAP repeat protein [Actinomycetota bacterium]